MVGTSQTLWAGATCHPPCNDHSNAVAQYKATAI